MTTRALTPCLLLSLFFLQCKVVERDFESEGDQNTGGSDSGGGAGLGGLGGSSIGSNCDPGYTGLGCQACADGYAPAGEDCIMDCGSCGEHQLCQRDPGPPACACAPTYVVDASTQECVFSGALVSTRFTDPDAWNLTQATIDPTAFGPNAGSARFNESAWCGGGAISQTVTMPPMSVAAPLVLELRAERLPLTNDCLMGGGFTGINLWLEGQVLQLGLHQNMATETVFKREYCLGEAAFGRDVDFRLIVDTERNRCDYDPSCPPPILHEVSIREALADECRSPLGEVLNGRFNSAEGWVLVANQSNGLGGARAEVVDGRLELEGQYSCSNVRATTLLSVPQHSTLPNAALRFDYAGTNGARSRLLYMGGGIEHQLTDELTGAGLSNWSEATICIPDFARGLVNDYRFELMNGLRSCSEADARTFYFDNVQLVSDPACEHEGVRDGGFELGTQLGLSSWDLIDGTESCGNCEGTARILSDSELARSGSRVLALEFAGIEDSGSPRAQTFARIPFATSAGGPALKFWYRKVGSGSGTLSSPAESGIVGSATWTEYTTCFQPREQGQVRTLAFSSLNSGSPSTHYIDDVRFAFDPNCP